MNPLFWPRWAQGLALGAALIAAFLAWDLFDDRAAVREHEARASAKTAETVLEAERSANRHDEVRRAARATQAEALQQARKEAIDEQSTGAVAGPAVRAVMRELRTQAAQDSHPAP